MDEPMSRLSTRRPGPVATHSHEPRRPTICLDGGSRPSPLRQRASNQSNVLGQVVPVSRNAVKAVIPISKSLRHIRNVSPAAVDANGNSVQMILRQCPISQDEVGALPETRANGC